jgi:hypothetical protein
MYNLLATTNQINVSKGWIPALIILVLWEAVWKLIALWKAGRNNQLAWFIVMAIINTAGILEIVYIFFYQPKNPKKKLEE